MFNNNTIKFLLSISLIFLFSCNKDNEVADISPLSTPNKDSCNLDQLLDEYQLFANQMNSAMKANDNTKILSINMDIKTWVTKWDDAKSNCTAEEELTATQKMLSIVNSINKGQ